MTLGGRVGIDIKEGEREGDSEIVSDLCIFVMFLIKLPSLIHRNLATERLLFPRLSYLY
jgi:hypothetical protein